MIFIFRNSIYVFYITCFMYARCLSFYYNNVFNTLPSEVSITVPYLHTSMMLLFYLPLFTPPNPHILCPFNKLGKVGRATGCCVDQYQHRDARRHLLPSQATRQLTVPRNIHHTEVTLQILYIDNYPYHPHPFTKKYFDKAKISEKKMYH